MPEVKHRIELAAGIWVCVRCGETWDKLPFLADPDRFTCVPEEEKEEARNA